MRIRRRRKHLSFMSRFRKLRNPYSFVSRAIARRYGRLF